jgi:hypothetical protein
VNGIVSVVMIPWRFTYLCRNIPILHQPEEALKAVAQIGRSNGQVNAGRRSKSEHKLKSFQHLNGPTQLHRVKV